MESIRCAVRNSVGPRSAARWREPGWCVRQLGRVQPIVAGRSADKSARDWSFIAPRGGPFYERNRQRSCSGERPSPQLAARSAGSDLRHTAASLWLRLGPTPILQRVLGHGSATRNERAHIGAGMQRKAGAQGTVGERQT